MRIKIDILTGKHSVLPTGFAHVSANTLVKITLKNGLFSPIHFPTSAKRKFAREEAKKHAFQLFLENNKQYSA
jgi:hypothetical protein